MINFSVSRLRSVSIPMRTCEVKKQSPQNKHETLYRRMRSNYFLIRWHCFLYLLSVLAIQRLAWGTASREKKRKRTREREREIIFSHILLTSALNGTKGAREAASANLKFGNNGRDRIDFFFAWS